MIYNESRGNPNIGWNKAGSHYSAGIAQISRDVWQSYSKLPYSEALNPKMYESNIQVAASYLKDNYKRFGNWHDALAAYNMGPTAWQQVKLGKRIASPITIQYISGVNN